MTNEHLETRQLIVDTATKIFTDLCDKALLDAAELGEFATPLWQTIVANGFHEIGAADSGTDAADLFAFLQACGRFSVPLPIADTLLVNRWCGSTDAIAGIGMDAGETVTGVVWGRAAQRVVAVQTGQDTIKLGQVAEVCGQGQNLAGEPEDEVCLADVQTLQLDQDPTAQLALARVNLMAGSLQAQLDLGIQFATERIQFGRAISKFQAIQHSLAVVAAEVAAAKRAADSAVDALQDPRFICEVAASKARVGEAVAVVAEQVHQIHGAMGFTHEHRLHHFSRRSWAWREQWGNEFYWQVQLGNHIAGLGADTAWDFIATQN